MSLFEKSKKAQYFIVGTVIIIIMSFAIISSNFVVSHDRDIFELLRQNFLAESTMAINSAAASGLNIEQSYLSYVTRFRDYAASRNVQFDVFYLLAYNDSIIVVNLFNADVETISANQRELLSHGDVVEFIPDQYFEINARGSYYSFEFGQDDVQLRAMLDISSR